MSPARVGRVIRRCVALLLVLGLAGCGDAAAAQTGTVTVFAAASLTESFTTLGRQFEEAHPGNRVVFNFGGSSALATQINEGAPADVFAAAAPANMATVTGAAAPVTFVRNQLVIAVTDGNPKRVTGLAGLTAPGLKVALCAESVPCGAAAATALAAAGVSLTPVTLEQDVKAALAKVRFGEVDAALVYRTDAEASAADVDGIEFPESAKAINDYPIVLLKDAANPGGGQMFIDYVLSADGVRVLTEAGFQAP
ncbi:molybdate ABC transporter substrate-binding protein [Actinoplanes sp. NPDC049802]|uniref:molybdate ABC transporter substrate-binding protein n=1 Tax=Actinoplanes sp. NPDC049802 TaxID=3154742 RepID=UPI0033C45F35